jgi:dihydrolipoamide dehydrogenase
MADFDVLVIGGGPAGYAAALKAAELGANVALVEAEKPGGACVHHACIPTEILLDAAIKHVEARELGVLGVFEVGEQFNFARAAARKNALVRQMAEGIGTALRMRNVQVIAGRAAFVSPHAISVTGAEGTRELSAEAFVIATGTRWEPPLIEGVAADRVLTADAAQALPTALKSALVLAGGPCEVDFGLEYATLLAIAGTEVTVVTRQPRLVPALDATLAGAARMAMTELGITVIEGVADVRGDGDEAILLHDGEETRVPAEIVVTADVRRPYFETLNLAVAGVRTDGRIPVDRGCRTNVPHIFAVGDVTGGLMLSSAASQMGEVAGTNAAGGEAVTRLSAVPRVLHGIPEIAWVGRSEETARADGYDVVAGVFDLSFNARAIALGARTGIVKVVAERELGQILGVHVVGPGAGEMIAVASGLMQAEATVHDLAAMVAWHPSMTEGLVEAAKRALA